MAHVKEHLCSNRETTFSYTLQRLNEKGVKAGEGRFCQPIAYGDREPVFAPVHTKVEGRADMEMSNL